MYRRRINISSIRRGIESRNGISVHAGAVEVHLGRQVHVVEWVRMTRMTSRSEDLRLQGDQPQEVYMQ